MNQSYVVSAQSIIKMKVKPFNSIPGPRPLPLIGALYRYLPIIGDYSFTRLHKAGLSKYLEYGPLVRERYPGVNLLNIFDPRDMAEVFANDGPFPSRRSHTAIKKYRLERPHMYSCGGLLPTNGNEWWRLRKEAQKVLGRIQCVRAHLPVIDEISNEFVNLITHFIREGNGKEKENFTDLLKRAFFEMTMATNLDIRFGALNIGVPLSDEDTDLMSASHMSNKNIIATDNSLQLWRWIDTPLYKEIVRGQDLIYKGVLKYVEAKEAELTAKRKLLDQKILSTSGNEEETALTTLEFSFLKTNLSKKDIVTVICDAVLGGTDTSTFAIGFLLYNLARHQDKQDKLASEADALLGKSGFKVTADVLDRARYLKAVVKEGMRLNPTALGIGRLATKDFVLRGFNIPKGTVLVTHNQVASRLEKYYPEADQFKPERWLDRKGQSTYPYLFLPFGHGPRMCIGRRTAEQNIYTLVLKIISAFKVEWLGERNLDCRTYLLNEPDSDLSFKFTPRERLS